MPDTTAPERNLRYDDVVHAMHRNRREPLCDLALIPACAPEVTTDPVDCMWCNALTS